jgi:polysaccharide biosynthesis/export protein
MNTWSSTLKTLTFSLILSFTAVPADAQKTLVPSPASDGRLDISNNAPQSSPGETGPGLHKRNWRYRINPSDTLELTFPLTPDFNQTVTVQPDGYITLRDAGDLSAAGHTLSELTESIKTAYSKILRDPEISVDPKDFEKPYFVVGGQVGKPGKFDWRGEVTLTQAIAIAGGFTDASKHSQVLLFRRVSDQWTEARIINVKKMLNSQNLQEDLELLPGDMLFVPKNALSKIKPFLPTSGVGTYLSLPTL